jgi:membrane-bound lytic murein transglycosylase D
MTSFHRIFWASLCLLFWAGCASQQQTAAVSQTPVATVLTPTVDSLALHQQDSLRRIHAATLLAEADSLLAVEMRTAKLKAPEKLARVRALAKLAERQAKTAPDDLKATLTEALEHISELLENEDLERDSVFCRTAYRLIQLYDEHVKPISETDTDSPALAVYERFFGSADRADIDDDLFIGMFLPKTQIPLELNSEVKKFIGHYSRGKLKGIFQRYLERAEIYFPVMKKIIAEENMPPEIIYLTLVESGVNPHARSRANAVGAWQFVKATGRLYGMEGNKWFDERRDVFKETRAAMRLLRDLYDLYKDWHLALAAYNAGGGRINRAKRLTKGSHDFWTLRKYFRRETSQYVPRYIAATIIALNPERFGFKPLHFQPPFEFDEVIVPDCTPLQTIADYAKVSLDTLLFLNPELIKGITPPAMRNYALKTPKGMGEKISEAVAQIPVSERLYFMAYKARRDDNLKTIAKRYSVSADALKSFNELANWNVAKGTVVMIPTTASVFHTVNYSLRDLSDDSLERRYRRYRKRRYASKGKRRRKSPTAAVSIAAPHNAKSFTLKK